MIILGIHDGHNASSCLMKDGKLIALLSEERMTYKKNDMGFPKGAIDECLRIAGISADEIDQVAYSSINLPVHYMRIKRECSFTVSDQIDEQEQYWKPLLYEGRLNEEYLQSVFSNPRFQCEQYYCFDGIPFNLTREENLSHLKRIRCKALQDFYGIDESKVRFLQHHDCHSYYAYFGSPFRKDKCLIITADGGGDGENGTVAIADNDKITKISANNCTDLARIYRYITLLLGMKIGEHEYKVMGLAPYVSQYEKTKTDKAFKDIFYIKNGMIEYIDRPKDLYFSFKEKLADCRFDGIAAGVQQMVEDIGLAWIKDLLEKHDIKRIVFSGGLAMNVKLNMLIGDLKEVEDFYVPASGGDESLSAGACYKAAADAGTVCMESIENNYLGGHPDRNEVLAAVSKIENVEIRVGATPEDVAELLANNKILGRMCGRMEFGARSLGNRSIIANPSDADNVKRINYKIKFRDFWMPFAPSVLGSHADEYLVNPKKHLSDHMTLAFDTTDKGKMALAAAIHPADGTVRAHIVREEINPDYYKLIQAFEKKTGIGSLLNTSFNLHGFPVVNKPEHAVHVFENSDLDGMIIDDILILRK